MFMGAKYLFLLDLLRQPGRKTPTFRAATIRRETAVVAPRNVGCLVPSLRSACIIRKDFTRVKFFG